MEAHFKRKALAMHKGLFIPASYKTQNGNNETKRNAETQRNGKPRLDQGLRLERGSVRGLAYVTTI